MTREIRLIKAGDKLTGLSIGDEKFLPLKTFVQRHAWPFQERSLARTYGLFEWPDGVEPTVPHPAKLIGYATLVCGEISVDKDGENLVADEGVEYRYRQYPAVKLARLLVDNRKRGEDLGSAFVDFSLGVALDIVSPAIGCRFLVVDAKSDSVGFYKKAGFTLLDTAENKRREEPVMFIDLMKV